MDRQFIFDKLKLDTQNFENKILKSIDQAIREGNEYANIELEWLGGEKLKKISSHPVMSHYLFTPDKPNNVQKTITKTYTKISDKYWEEQQIGLFFGARDGGSCVSIENTNNKELMTKFLNENKENRQKILKRCLMTLAGMNKNDIKQINLKGVSMIGMHWPFVMRSISEELGINGKIVLVDGGYRLKCLKD